MSWGTFFAIVDSGLLIKDLNRDFCKLQQFSDSLLVKKKKKKMCANSSEHNIQTSLIPTPDVKILTDQIQRSRYI